MWKNGQVQRRFLNARTSNQNMQQGRALDAAPVHCLSLSCDICIFLIFVFVFISGWIAHFAFHLWHWIFSKTCLAIDEIHLSQPQATESFTPEKSRHWHGASLALADGFYVFIFKIKASPGSPLILKLECQPSKLICLRPGHIFYVISLSKEGGFIVNTSIFQDYYIVCYHR